MAQVHFLLFQQLKSNSQVRDSLVSSGALFIEQSLLLMVSGFMTMHRKFREGFMILIKIQSALKVRPSSWSNLGKLVCISHLARRVSSKCKKPPLVLLSFSLSLAQVFYVCPLLWQISSCDPYFQVAGWISTSNQGDSHLRHPQEGLQGLLCNATVW